jgi:probable rRNA maturation factor
MVQATCLGKFPAGMTRKTVSSLVAATCRRVGRKEPRAISFRVVDDKTIRALNRAHRGKNAVTDVLSFSVADNLPASVRQHGGDLGDVVISLPQVARQARQIGRNVKAEFALMVVHGTLHLLGYDHETLADERRMFNFQQDVLMGAGFF